MLRKRLKYILTLLAVGSLGIALGYYLSPTKIKIEEKIIEKEKISREQTKRITEKFDAGTGRIIERTTETGEKQVLQNKKSEETKKEKVREKKQWAVKAGAQVEVLNPSRYIPIVGLETRLPIFDTFIGIEAIVDLDNPRAGMYLRLEF